MEKKHISLQAFFLLLYFSNTSKCVLKSLIIVHLQKADHVLPVSVSVRIPDDGFG